jgi:putative inorganic carbon (hco3(-)) transporter
MSWPLAGAYPFDGELGGNIRSTPTSPASRRAAGEVGKRSKPGEFAGAEGRPAVDSGHRAPVSSRADIWAFRLHGISTIDTPDYAGMTPGCRDECWHGSTVQFQFAVTGRSRLLGVAGSEESCLGVSADLRGGISRAMRSLLLLIDMMLLLPISLVHPFVGVLVFDWISFMNPQQISWGFASGWPWALIAFVFTVTGWILSPTEPKHVTITPMIVLMVLFVIGITANMPFALSPAGAEYDAWLRTTKIFVFLIITAALLTNRRRIDALIWIMIISVGYYILDQGGASIATLGGHKAFGPPNSQITDNNAFAAAVLILVPMMNYLRLQARHALIRFGFFLAMTMSILTSLASYSRGALLGVLAVLFVFWLKSKQKIASLIALTTTLVAVLLFMPQKWWDRMHTITHYQGDKSAEGRLYIWRIAWKLFERHPLTGVGFHATDYPYVIDTVDPGGNVHDIHSIWFQMLAEQGIVVFCIWLAMLAVGLFGCWRLARITRKRPEVSWAYDLARMGQISMLAYFVTGTFLPLSTWDIFFTILVAISAAVTVVERERAASQVAAGELAWHPAPTVGRRLAHLGQAR